MDGDAAGGGTELGLDHPGVGLVDVEEAESFAVTSREWEWMAWGDGRTINLMLFELEKMRWVVPNGPSELVCLLLDEAELPVVDNEVVAWFFCKNFLFILTELKRFTGGT